MNWVILLTVLMALESSNDLFAIGDNGKSVGCLQIQAGVIQDVNRIYGTDYTLQDRYSLQKSKDICRMYLTYWGNKALKDTGEEQFSYELLARIWNGGPRGYRKQVTDRYWDKFETISRAMGLILEDNHEFIRSKDT